jgi:Putative prokaryotic signal transducing protein
VPDALRSLTTVGSEAEAEMVCDRLLANGIHAITQRTIGGPEWGSSGARVVMVDARDLDRAQALLASEERAFTDEELTRLSEEAGREGEDT